MTVHLRIPVLAALLFVAARPAAAPPDVRVTVVAPEADSYISGPVVLRARVEPDGTPASVTFFADGRQVCRREQPPFECDWDAGPLVSAHAVRAVATLADGRRIAHTIRTRALGYVDAVNVEAVQVTATITDAEGHYVRGLPRSAFHVREDDRPQEISSFASENIPLDLIVAVDISGSMVPAAATLRTTVKEFLRSIPPKDEVTLLAFNDNIFTLSRRATGPEERVKSVDRLSPWGYTSLYDVLIRGVDLLGRRTGRKAMIVFTDGEDQGSHGTIEMVERRLQSSDATLYMIGQGEGLRQSQLKDIMGRLVRPTGGRALFTDNIDELHGAFAELLDELSNQYLLGYVPKNSRKGDAWRRIRVDVDGGYHVRARQGYRPGGAK